MSGTATKCVLTANPEDPAMTSLPTPIAMKLEAIVIPVSDVGRAATFYAGLGWRVDADITAADGGRILQFTPPGSPASILIGTGLTPSVPGTTQFVHLIVPDIVAARAELIGKGIDASDVFHDASGGYNRFDPALRASGPDPDRRSYASFVTFHDPDGNGFVLQEITTRFPGRIDGGVASFASAQDLAHAMQRASAAHGKREARLGKADPDWPGWYATYMVAEQTGDTLPD
jgi:catechol 2,3-dioxygenase-like lactoylglutathione lyase family enzyme